MAAGRVTLQHVAERAGVSKTTASFVLTGRRDMRISADAEERVVRAARELDYRPNLMARSLRTNVSQTIGLVSDVIATEAFAGEMIRGALSTAILNQHLLFIGESEGDPQIETSLVQSMSDRGVGGFVYASMYTRRVEVPASMLAHPLVLLNCLPTDGDVACVVPDEIAAGRVAAQTLVDAGHRDGIVIVGEVIDDVLAGRDRRQGIEEILTEASTSVADTIDCLWWPEAAYDAVSAFLRAGGEVSAFICLNDRVALGTYQALQQHGLVVPDDVSVISFDDSDLARWMRPALTSLALPHFELGRRAVELLLDGSAKGGVHRVPMPVRRRASVAARATAGTLSRGRGTPTR